MEIRVLLDTCAIRSHIHQGPFLLPVDAVRARLESMKVSIADSAMAELLEQRVANRVPDWDRRVGEIDSILDTDQPIFPGGNELARLAGTQLGEEPDRADRLRYYREGWQLLRDARDIAELQRPRTYKTADGRAMQIRLDLDTLHRVMDDERNGWIAFIERMKDLIGAETNMTREQILAIMHNGLRPTAPTDPADIASKLDGVVQVLASFIYLGLNGATPYNPRREKRRGDVFDWTLLFALPLPAIVCTADKKFVNRFRSLNSRQASQLVTMEEFSRHTEDDTLQGLLPWHV